MTIIIYLIGRPGIGKLTIAKELSKSNFLICDNHLINNPVFKLLGSNYHQHIPDFAWQTTQEIRTSILNFIAQENKNNYIFTNVLYDTAIDHKIYNEISELAFKKQSLFVPVILDANIEENIKRLKSASRAQAHKITNPEIVNFNRSLIEINHPNKLKLDISSLTAKQTAKIIIEHIKEL